MAYLYRLMNTAVRNYQVTIEGIGPRLYVDYFSATSAGLAKVAAEDRFGRWIRVVEIKELLNNVSKPPKPTSKTVRKKRRRSSAD